MQLQLKVNGKPVTADVPPNTLLVQLLREHLQLTGTHVGCDTAQCGACTVLVQSDGGDRRAIKSCNVLAAQMQGAEVTTIEGIAAADGTMHPMQAAFKDAHGLQCGFCTPGMVLSSIDLLAQHPQASEAEIRELLEGNICRCTGYQNIVKAVQQAQQAMA
jgi:carbon-monoxide dehydrogenase small subunit